MRLFTVIKFGYDNKFFRYHLSGEPENPIVQYAGTIHGTDDVNNPEHYVTIDEFIELHAIERDSKDAKRIKRDLFRNLGGNVRIMWVDNKYSSFV